MISKRAAVSARIISLRSLFVLAVSATKYTSISSVNATEKIPRKTAFNVCLYRCLPVRLAKQPRPFSPALVGSDGLSYFTYDGLSYFTYIIAKKPGVYKSDAFSPAYGFAILKENKKIFLFSYIEISFPHLEKTIFPFPFISRLPKPSPSNSAFCTKFCENNIVYSIIFRGKVKVYTFFSHGYNTSYQADPPPPKMQHTGKGDSFEIRTTQ